MGISTRNSVLLFSSALKPRDSNIFLYSCAVSVSPKTAFERSTVKSIDLGISFFGYTSRSPFEAPPASLIMRSARRRIAKSAKFGSNPCSKRREASVLRFSSREPLRTTDWLKFAASRTIVFVSFETPEPFPPLMPATATGPSPSAITRIFGLST